jgi:multicomponent Na+:H+ antiporter subunit G
MSISEIISAILLSLGILIEWIACVGLFRMPTVYARLHAAAPANILPPIVVAAAILVSEGLSQSGVKAILIALVLIFTSPVISHATARAAWNRQTGRRQE